MTTPDTLIAEREKTHGRFIINARIGQEIRHVYRASPYWEQMSYVQREALDHIAGKIGRILAGGEPCPDHFADIGGYARLGELDVMGKL